MNNVVPSRQRVVDEKGRIDFGEYMVNEPAVPELVARGVLPFRFIKMRDDADTRFADCDSPIDVLEVLRSEGYWVVKGHADKPVEMLTEPHDLGEKVDSEWKNIKDPVERRRAYNRVKKREERARKNAST